MVIVYCILVIRQARPVTKQFLSYFLKMKIQMRINFDIFPRIDMINLVPIDIDTVSGLQSLHQSDGDDNESVLRVTIIELNTEFRLTEGNVFVCQVAALCRLSDHLKRPKFPHFSL